MTKKNDWKYFNDKSDNNIVNTDVCYAYPQSFINLSSIHYELSHLLSSSSTGFNVSLINMHIFFLNTYQNKKTRVLGENPAQYRTNDTPLT